MSKLMIAGVALAAAIGTSASAEAGHRRSCCTCQPSYGMSHQGGWYYSRSGSGYYVPMARTSPETTPAQAGPPVAMGPGQTIRRFSEEPNTPAAPVTNATVYAGGSGPRMNFPTVGTYIPPNPSKTPARNPVERRLHPGGGWMRN
jgi:hypothetical protein